MSGLGLFIFLRAAAVLLGLSRLRILDTRGAVVGSRKAELRKIGLAQPIFLHSCSVHHLPPFLHAANCWSIVVLLGIQEDITIHLPDFHTLPHLSLHGPWKGLYNIHLDVHPVIITLVIFQSVLGKGIALVGLRSGH